MDERTISPEALQLMLAMTVPMRHLEWYAGGHGDVNPCPLKVDLPGRRFNRLDPGYGGYDAVDNEICQRIMVRSGLEKRILTFPPGMLERLEYERKPG